MKIYQVIHNNGEAYEDNYEYTCGVYTTKEQAEKEILHGGYMTKGDWSNPYEKGVYYVDKDSWAKEMNADREMDSDYTVDEFRPDECTDYSWAVIKELELLEIFSPDDDEVTE